MSMHVVTKAVRSELDPALQLITTRALVLTGGSGAALALAHDGFMICRASVGTSAPPLGCRLGTTSGFSGECIRTGKGLRCDDAETDPRVDAESCRRLGIRSVLAAPIFFKRELVGLLEVFSAQPFAFDEGDLNVIDRLAQMAIPTTPDHETTPPPKLLVEWEQAHQVFLRNLNDLVRPPRMAPLKLTSSPASFWADVFVPSRLPWEQFLQSIVMHVVMILALGGLLEFWLSQQHSVQRIAFRKSDVIYYSPSEYLQALSKGRAPLRAPKTQRSAAAPSPVIRVVREKNSRTQALTAPPELKLKPQLRLLRLVALNPVTPAMPLAATTRTRLITPPDLVTAVAPPPDINRALSRRTSTGMNSTAAVVGPPPEISGISRTRAMSAPGAVIVGPPPQIAALSGQRGLPAPAATVIGPPPQIAAVSGRRGLSAPSGSVIAPPPQMAATQIAAVSGLRGVTGPPASVVGPPPQIAAVSGRRGLPAPATGIIGPPPPIQQLVRQIGGINVGYVQVVAPAPQMSQREQGTVSAMVQASLRGTVTSVVPPSPSVSSSGSGGAQRINPISVAPLQAALPPALVRNASNVTRTGSSIPSVSPAPNLAPPGELIDDSQVMPPGTKEMSVNFIGLALALPSSSYFSSHEVFLAEGRFSRKQSRLIKLVYEYLPYQSRLSDYGPDYPALDRLRVTRDPSCDEKLLQVVSSSNAPGWPRSDRLQQALQYSDRQENTLECYRTTADDYRVARARRR
jgi:hypothetical protein